MGDNMLRGPQFGPLNTAVPQTASFTGAQRVALAQGRYYDAAYNRQLFYAANQAATTWSVALAATHTGFVLSNPINSGFVLVPLLAGFVLAAAPVAIAPMLFFGGWSNAGITAHTTPLSALSTDLSADQSNAVGKADAAATLVGTPRWILPFLGGFTAGALPAVSPAFLDIGGAIYVPPGAYFGIGAITAVSGLASMIWEELPILAS